ncbi:MAG TPA: tRNA (N6-isopentenyl adenosine(37)-C2)-methylthiotransferase MiaB [Polyangia bacterium]|nr:tRNA (N6-isopentenyl adenosine(37)-C2)-methylthiotransferase MiaB [Polyangia bacterium]
MEDLVQLRRPKGTSAVAPAPERLAYVETYGCQMNVADTDMVLGLLQRAGYGRTEDPSRADLILINTCAVREKAEERVFARASMLAHAKGRPDAVLGITGCMAEHLKDKIRERVRGVDLVVGPDGYRRLLDHVATARAGAAVIDTKLDRAETYEGIDGIALGDTEAAGVVGRVTIQRGCDKFCTFCVVPYTRGRERGVPPREVLRQARGLVESGCKEIQLLGQTVNSYRYEDVGFAELLRAVAAVDGLARVRFTSPYPLDFSDDVIAAMAETPNIAKHVHLPLQSAADPVLARMRRGYDYPTFRTLVSKLRAAMPDVAITTDILVGFCDETEEEHAATLRAQEELRFDGAFTFAYSEREGTTAARKMPDTVPPDVKHRRLAEVIAVQQRITAEILAAQVGRRERILIEHVSKRNPHELMGRTDTFRPVIVPTAPGLTPGALVDVTITRATPATLFGAPS